jgi:putative peptidoglycan lipid II flippase
MSDDSIGRRMGKATLIMVLSVLLSRVMGFVREMVIAAHAGASAEADVYFAAFTLPDFLNHLLSGGALSITFIPIFSRHLASGSADEKWRVTSVVLSNMTFVSVVLIVLLEIFADDLVPLIAPGFDEERRAATASLVRIILPAQYCFYVGGILMAVQYAHERFLLPALAPILYNLGIITGGLLLAPALGMEGFSWGVLFGAFVGNLAVQALGARRVGARFTFRVDLRDREFLEFLKLSLPLMVGLSLVLVDEWIGKALGSYLVAASISWLNYARVLMRVPTAILGQAAGVASYPFLARLAAEGRRADLDRTLGRALRAVLFYILPASALCAVLGREMAVVLFGRGRFTPADAVAVGKTLFWFSLGIFAWGAEAIVARGFYALRDTVTPTLVGTLFTVAVLPIAYGLMGTMEHEGIALASSLGIIGYATCLYLLFRRRLGRDGSPGEPAHTAAHLGRAALASALAGGAAYALLVALGDALPWATLWGSLARCVLGGIACAAVYVGAGLLLRVEGMTGILGRLTGRAVKGAS